jgi:ribonuclease VapC
MIIDTSALIALLRDEPDAPCFADALATRAEPKRLSAANSLEAAIVIDGSRDPVASGRLDEVIAKANIIIDQ